MDCYLFIPHQAEAVNLARRGQNRDHATSSASGKTLCYNISDGSHGHREKLPRPLSFSD
jgi:hypothetical protein